MYIHIGLDTVLKKENIVGIFDLDNTTISARSRDFLRKAEQAGEVVNVTKDLPKTFILCSDKNKKRKIYISQISTSTLLKRSFFAEKKQMGRKEHKNDQ